MALSSSFHEWKPIEERTCPNGCGSVLRLWTIDSHKLICPLRNSTIEETDYTKFWKACSVGDVEKVEDMLSRGSVPSDQAFRLACYNGRVAVLKLLLDSPSFDFGMASDGVDRGLEGFCLDILHVLTTDERTKPFLQPKDFFWTRVWLALGNPEYEQVRSTFRSYYKAVVREFDNSTPTAMPCLKVMGRFSGFPRAIEFFWAEFREDIDLADLVTSILPMCIHSSYTLSSQFMTSLIRSLKSSQNVSATVKNTMYKLSERSLDLMTALISEGLLMDLTLQQLERFEGDLNILDFDKPYPKIRWKNEGWHKLIATLFYHKHLLICKGDSPILNQFPYEIRDIIASLVPIGLANEFHTHRQNRIQKIDIRKCSRRWMKDTIVTNMEHLLSS